MTPAHRVQTPEHVSSVPCSSLMPPRAKVFSRSVVREGSTDDLRAHPFQCPFPPTVLLNNSGAKGTWNCSILLEFGDPASWCLTGLQSRLLITLLLGQAPWERCFCQSWFSKIQWWGREGTAALLSSDLRMC